MHNRRSPLSAYFITYSSATQQILMKFVNGGEVWGSACKFLENLVLVHVSLMYMKINAEIQLRIFSKYTL
jgi:hypothetical protein